MLSKCWDVLNYCFEIILQMLPNESPDLDFEYDDTDRYEVEISGRLRIQPSPFNASLSQSYTATQKNRSSS